MYIKGSSEAENDGISTFCQDTRTVSGSMSTMVGLLIGTPGKSVCEQKKKYVIHTLNLSFDKSDIQ